VKWAAARDPVNYQLIVDKSSSVPTHPQITIQLVRIRIIVNKVAFKVEVDVIH
jgi:hypothetical protein